MIDSVMKDILIELRYRNQNMAAIKESQRAATELKRRWSDARDAIRSFGDDAARVLSLGGLVSGAVGVGMVGYLTKTASAAEDARLGITTLIQSADSMVGGPFANVQAAFAESAKLMADMRLEAVNTPGTFEDISAAWRDTAVQARMAGADYSETIKLAGNMATLSKVYGFEGGVVSRDVQQMLRGEFGDVATPQLMAIKEQVKELHKAGKEAEKLALIMNATDLNPDLKKKFGEGFTGTFASLQDEWSLFAGEAGKPIMGWLTDQMKEALTWINANREAVKGWAIDLGEGVVSVMEDIKAALVWMWKHREDIIGWAVSLGTAVATVFGFVGDLIGGLESIIGLGPALGVALGLALGPIGKAAIALGWIVDSIAKIAKETAGGMPVGATDFFPNAVSAEEGRKRWAQVNAEKKAILGQDTFTALGVPVELALGYDPKARDGFGRYFVDNLASGYSLFDKSQAGAEALRRQLQADGARQAMSALSPNEAKIKLPWDMRTPVPPVIHANGTKITINQRVETDNPAQLARASLLAGFTAVVRSPIRALQREGSVGLGNGDTGR
jgi:hypothetical protein